MRWRIYYADGSTYSSEDGPGEEAPPYGMQVILQADEVTGTRRLRYGDFYTYHAEADEWMAHDLPGMIFQMTDRGYIKHGAAIPVDQWRAIYAAACDDPDFPKSASAPGENPDHETVQYDEPHA